MTNSRTPRLCEQEGCAVRYTPVSANQRFCTDHAYLAQSMKRAFAPRHCVVCRQKYQPARDKQLVCGDRCRRAHEAARDLAQRQATYGTKECACGATFVPMSWKNYRCRACSAPGKAPIIRQQKPEVPCLACRHGKAQPQAELGVECTAGVWTRCKPLTHALQFSPAQEAQEGEEG